MKQHAINLLPESIRARSQAGLRAGRYIVAGTLSVLAVILATTHTRLDLDRARVAQEIARDQANQALATEEKVRELSMLIADAEKQITRYARLAMPLRVGDVLATAINGLPDGVSLDRVDIDAGARRQLRSPRDRAADGSATVPTRVMSAELTGFAPNDAAIARFVQHLKSTGLCRDVNLDFSRARDIRTRTAREFRLSFLVNLETRYEIASAADESSGHGLGGTSDE